MTDVTTWQNNDTNVIVPPNGWALSCTGFTNDVSRKQLNLADNKYFSISDTGASVSLIQVRQYP